MINISEHALMSNTYASQATNAAVSAENLALYEVQKPLVEPILRACRLWNIALDALFYDVGLFSASLLAKGTFREKAGTARDSLNASCCSTPSSAQFLAHYFCTFNHRSHFAVGNVPGQIFQPAVGRHHDAFGRYIGQGTADARRDGFRGLDRHVR
jgi:hypothetical protein